MILTSRFIVLKLLIILILNPIRILVFYVDIWLLPVRFSNRNSFNRALLVGITRNQTNWSTSVSAFLSHVFFVICLIQIFDRQLSRFSLIVLLLFMTSNFWSVSQTFAFHVELIFLFWSLTSVLCIWRFRLLNIYRSLLLQIFANIYDGVIFWCDFDSETIE